MDIGVRKVLIAGESTCFHLRAAGLLPPPDFEIRFTADASKASQVIQEARFDIVIVEFGGNSAAVREFVRNLRWSGSLSRNATAVLLCESHELDEAEEYLCSGFSRILNPTAPRSVLSKALDEVFNHEPRYPVRALVRISGEGLGHDGVVMTQTANLSATGMLIHFERQVFLGSRFAFTLEIPGLSHGIRGTAAVVRLAPGRGDNAGGFAARFADFEGNGGDQLKRFLSTQRIPKHKARADL